MTSQKTTIPPTMKPWHGGDSAPEDWDGGPVLWKNGSICAPSGPRSFRSDTNGGVLTIIAYTAATVAEADVERLYKRACEVVRHDADCPSIGGNGDADCRCDAVPFLRDLAALQPRAPDGVGAGDLREHVARMCLSALFGFEFNGDSLCDESERIFSEPNPRAVRAVALADAILALAAPAPAPSGQDEGVGL